MFTRRFSFTVSQFGAARGMYPSLASFAMMHLPLWSLAPSDCISTMQQGDAEGLQGHRRLAAANPGVSSNGAASRSIATWRLGVVRVGRGMFLIVA